jgi:LysM repeat protein
VSRRRLAHVAAPVVFLAGVTAAVLLVRAGLEGSHSPASTLGGTVVHQTTSTGAGGTSSGRTKTTGTAGARYYTVQKGDTFGAIASHEHTTIAELETLNPGVSPTALQVGERIRVH